MFVIDDTVHFLFWVDKLSVGQMAFDWKVSNQFWFLFYVLKLFYRQTFGKLIIEWHNYDPVIWLADIWPTNCWSTQLWLCNLVERYFTDLMLVVTATVDTIVDWSTGHWVGEMSVGQMLFDQTTWSRFSHLLSSAMKPVKCFRLKSVFLTQIQQRL